MKEGTQGRWYWRLRGCCWSDRRYRVLGKSTVLWLLSCLLALTAPVGAAEITPQRLLEVVDLAGPVLSPDGTMVAFRAEQASVEHNRHSSSWYVAGLGSNPLPRAVGDGGMPLRDSSAESLSALALWSPDGAWLYYRADIDGRVAVWRAAVDGSGTERVTQDDADVRQFQLDGEGKRVLYSVGATREQIDRAEALEYHAGVQLQAQVPVGAPLFRSGSRGGRSITERFGRIWFNRVPLLDEVPEHWKVVAVAGGAGGDVSAAEPALLSPAPIDLPQGLVAWEQVRDPSAARIAVLSKAERPELFDAQQMTLSVVMDRHSPPIECQAEPCRGKAIGGLMWRPGSEELLFTVSDPEQAFSQSIFRWQVGSATVRRVAGSRGLLGGGRDPASRCALSASLLVCVSAEADRPPRLESIALETGDRRVLYDPNHLLAADIAARVPAQRLRWHDRDGQAFDGWYFAAPSNAGKAQPLFITYYRCHGFLRGGVGDEWPLAALAEQGIASLCINAPPYRTEAMQRYAQGLSAVASAITLLGDQGKVDRAKVGMGGLSFGSEITLWVETESSLLAAASISTPVLSPNFYLLSSLKGESFREGLRRHWGLGSPEETPARWQQISPAFKLARFQAPLLLQMSEQEYLYAADYAIPLINRSRADAYVFPDEPHQKFQPRHKLAVYQRNVDWFRFWLQGVEDADPAKAAQYRYWRSMRDQGAAAAGAGGR